PWPKRAAAPSESVWSTTPSRTTVTVSNPRCGCWGNPGTVVPWYMDQPSRPEKSWPICRPSSEAAGRMVVPSAAGNRSRWWAVNRNGSIPGHWAPSGTTWRTTDTGSSYDLAVMSVNSRRGPCCSRRGPGGGTGSAPRNHAGDRDEAVDGLAEVEHRPVDVEVVGHHDRRGGAAITEDLVRELRVLDGRVGVALLGDPPRRDAGATEPVPHRLRLGAT